MPAMSCACASTVFSVILFPWTSAGTAIGVVEFRLRLKDRTTSLPLASKKSSAITVSLILMERTPFSCERRAELLYMSGFRSDRVLCQLQCSYCEREDLAYEFPFNRICKLTVPILAALLIICGSPAHSGLTKRQGPTSLSLFVQFHDLNSFSSFRLEMNEEAVHSLVNAEQFEFDVSRKG